MTPEERLEFEEMKLFIKSLKASATIPIEVDRALRDRLSTGGKISGKTVASETQAVSESGSSNYNVPKLHDGYKQETVAGKIIHLPYYDG